MVTKDVKFLFQIDRIARIAFETAQKRRGKLCSVDKANVLEVEVLLYHSASHDMNKNVVCPILPSPTTSPFSEGRNGKKFWFTLQKISFVFFCHQAAGFTFSLGSLLYSLMML